MGFFLMNCDDAVNREWIEYAILGVAVATTVLGVAVAVTILAALVLAVAVTVFTTFAQIFK